MISLFASAINTQNWQAYSDSLLKNDIDYEIVFVGPVEPDKDYKNLRYIKTKNIKPAQCYEIGARESKGDVLALTCDDAIYPPHFLDNINKHFDDGTEKVVGFDIHERGGLCCYESYTLGDIKGGYIMCSFGLFPKSLFTRLGGFDYMFITGQYENDFFMRCHAEKIPFEKYSDQYITAVHDPVSLFSNYHTHGRSMNKDLWYVNYTWQLKRTREVLSYSNEGIKEYSQGPRGEWL